MYKLIALDLDGTLTDKNKNILEETKQELIKLAQKGVRRIFIIFQWSKSFRL